ncbi:hypothetical protein U729_3174 (plasmid) [Clostridium baratii str. Sullivan]|uniref:Uncharacterized protein n=1 Tax=Clostridium baratii str. Sullivan TaxID=1415775 RepID=A0A0A7G033_9CLOT|nr:hypothetical protein [Clostridium baratii]AIY85234.1 hypothetical protein U729_3174 [Clostridium baratii str. Sullivan]
MKYLIVDLDRTIATGTVHYWKQNLHGYTTAKEEAGTFLFEIANRLAVNDIERKTCIVPEGGLNGI